MGSQILIFLTSKVCFMSLKQWFHKSLALKWCTSLNETTLLWGQVKEIKFKVFLLVQFQQQKEHFSILFFICFPGHPKPPTKKIERERQRQWVSHHLKICIIWWNGFALKLVNFKIIYFLCLRERQLWCLALVNNHFKIKYG